MDGLDWMRYIKDRRPEYAVSREPLIKRFANKGSSKGDYVQFGPVYQLYMYAFMLGFHKNERIPLPDKSKERAEFYPLGKWEPEGIVNYILMLLLSNSSLIKEADIDFNEMEDMEEDQVKPKFNKLIKIMEEYANAGFSILEERFERNPYFFNDSFAFTLLLKDIVDGKS